MKKSIIESGKVYGKWTVLEQDLNIINKGGGVHRKWICKCECGTIKSINSSSLRSNRTSQCRKCKDRSIKPGTLLCGLYKIIKRRALSINKGFNLTEKYLYNLLVKQNFKCALSGVDICIRPHTQKSGGSKNTTASLDRIDSNKGYEIGNVQWVDKKINTAKHVLSQDEFINMCQLVIDYNTDC